MSIYTKEQLAAMDRAGELPISELPQHFHNNQQGDQQMNMAETTQFDTKAHFLNQHQKEGEIYAGLLLGKDGEPDQHIFLLPGQVTDVTWSDAKKFAEKAGGMLPTRREQALLYANLPEQFDKRWYWSCEQPAGYPDCAWVQGFSIGRQSYGLKSDQYRARAVRRSPL
jgi:hypothetical protein